MFFLILAGVLRGPVGQAGLRTGGVARLCNLPLLGLLATAYAVIAYISPERSRGRRRSSSWSGHSGSP